MTFLLLAFLALVSLILVWLVEVIFKPSRTNILFLALIVLSIVILGLLAIYIYNTNLFSYIFIPASPLLFFVLIVPILIGAYIFKASSKNILFVTIIALSISVILGLLAGYIYPILSPPATCYDLGSCFVYALAEGLSLVFISFLTFALSYTIISILLYITLFRNSNT